MMSCRAAETSNMMLYPSEYWENNDNRLEEIKGRVDNSCNYEILPHSQHELLMSTIESSAHPMVPGRVMTMRHASEMTIPNHLVQSIPIRTSQLSLAPSYTSEMSENPSRSSQLSLLKHTSERNINSLSVQKRQTKDDGCCVTFWTCRAHKCMYLSALMILVILISAIGTGVYFMENYSESPIQDEIWNHDTHDSGNFSREGSPQNADNNYPKQGQGEEHTSKNAGDENKNHKDLLHPPVPGIRLAGLTIDALYGTNTDRRVIDMDVFTHGKTFSDTSTSNIFSVPNSVQNVHRESSCSSDISVKEYKNTEEYTKSYTIGLDVGYGAFSLSPEMTWSTTSMTASNGRLYEAKLSCVSYKAALNTESLDISSEFRKVILKLPDDENDWESFLTFFKAWGTHFYDTVELGGIMQSNVVYSEDYVAKKKSFEMKVAAKVSLDVSVGAKFGMEDKDLNEARNNQNATKQFHRGGNPETFFKSGFESWVGTIDNNPDVINFKLAPLSDLVKTINLKKGEALEKAVKKYLNYVGNLHNPADSCFRVHDVAKHNNYRIYDEGVFYIKEQTDEQSTPTLCNFDIGDGGWTLVVNKLGGWEGSFKSTNAWHKNTRINNLRPTLVADYKMQFIETVGSQYVKKFMMQANFNARKGARISGTFDQNATWEIGPMAFGGNFGVRRKLIKFRDVVPKEPLYLVLSYDGGMCVINPTYGNHFNCDGNSGQSSGQGLFDRSSRDEFANCNTYSWKDFAGGNEPGRYFGQCGAIGTYTSQDCGEGQVVYPNCCNTHFADGSYGCGFFGCRCKCIIARSHVSYCGTEVGYVSLWFL